MKNKNSAWLRIFFLLYVGLMLWLLFGQRFQGQLVFAGLSQLLEQTNLEPLRTIHGYLWLLKNSADREMLREAVINLGGNVIMFVPLGFFMAELFPKLRRFWPALLWTVILICAVEFLQGITLLGRCDIDDLLLNLPGSMIGWGAWKMIHRNKK